MQPGMQQSAPMPMHNHTNPYSSSPQYGQQPQPMQQQNLMQNWPSFFPKEVIGLDRGVIFDETNPIMSSQNLFPRPGALEAVRTMRLKGYKVMIFFNEPLIFKKVLTEQHVNETVQGMMNIFGQAGIFSIEGLLYSTTNLKEDIYSMPNNGMLKKAENENKITFKGGYFVGDKLYNLKAGESCGAKPILIDVGQSEDAKQKLETFANKELKSKTKIYGSLLDFANSLQ